MKCSLGISNFLEETSSLSHSVVCFYFLCIDHWGRLSCLSLLFFGTLHSNGYIFPFLLCFSLLFFSQLFVRPPQTPILLLCISFPCGWSWSLSPVQDSSKKCHSLLTNYWCLCTCFSVLSHLLVFYLEGQFYLERKFWDWVDNSYYNVDKDLF